MATDGRLLPYSVRSQNTDGVLGLSEKRKVDHRNGSANNEKETKVFKANVAEYAAR